MESFIKLIGLYEPVTEAFQKDFEAKAKTVMVRKKDHLINAKQKSDTMFFVKKGLLRIYKDTPKLEVTLRYCKELDLCNVLTNKNENGLNIVAEEDSEVITIENEKFIELSQKYKGLTYFAINHLSVNQQKENQRLINLLSLDAEEIYLDFVKNNRDLFSRTKGKHLSTYLGVTQETISRIKSRHGIKKK